MERRLQKFKRCIVAFDIKDKARMHQTLELIQVAVIGMKVKEKRTF